MIKNFAHVVSRYASEKDGATAIEYGLVASLIAVGVAAVCVLIGDELLITFNALLAEMQA